VGDSYLKFSSVNPKLLGLLASIGIYLVIAIIYFTTPTEVQLFVYANGFSVTAVYAVLDLLGMFQQRNEGL
jgi:hypothetical protein